MPGTRNQPGEIRSRRTPLSAHGEPMLWLTSLALVASIVMIVGLVGVIVWQGARTFWPRPVELVTLESGERFLGVRVDEESFDPPPGEAERFEVLREINEQAFDENGRPIRAMFRVGNRDLGTEPFRWESLADIESIGTPDTGILLERESWGVFFGTPGRLLIVDDLTLDPQEVAPTTVETPLGPVEGSVEERGTTEDGERVVRRVAVVSEGAEETLDALARVHPEARARAAEIKRITRHDVGRINAQLEAARLRVRSAEMALDDSSAIHDPLLATSGWWGVLALSAVLLMAGVVVSVMASDGDRRRTWLRVGLVAGGLVGLLFVWLERPMGRAEMTPERLAEIREQAQEQRERLNGEYEGVLERIGEIRAEDSRYRIEVIDPNTGRFAPVRQTEPDEPMLVSQIVRVVPANQLSTAGRWGVYFDRWGEFLTDDPRESNTEGGVFPVIFGTVVLTLLLVIVVIPLGVIAALYLREYARQGAVTSLVRVAVNNLAGVPSIVYGVFGLGFFCYTIGAYIDVGSSMPAPRSTWWYGLVAALLIGVIGWAVMALASPGPGSIRTRRHDVAKFIGVGCWLGVAGLTLVLIATNPYFGGFFAAKNADGNSTFGARGMLWASLTLALLTLPVVIVATEEAIAAIPNSMREGSYGCGASKWQTVRRILLPAAMPGIMTGAILAMARGAGEVAPLMLVGAVKLNEELPFSSEPPFVHLERSFMHLGFHIYDLGFQSPDSQAARPLVWTTTLLLLLIVLMLNFAAILIRARLRRKLRGGEV